MTKEEAIHLLKNTAWLAPSTVPIDEAIDMAVEALTIEMGLERLRGITHEQKEIIRVLEEGDRPKGRWLTSNGVPTKNQYAVYCSECENWSEYASDFCMNCGADMRGENNDERRSD